MIEFKVISTPDRSQLASYRHVGEELTIGNDEAEMVLDDPQLGSVQARLYFEGAKCYIENLMPEVEVRINGKAIDGASPLKVKDNITMGRTTLNFTALDTKPIPPPESFVHPQASTRFAEDTAEKAILDALDFLADPSGSTPPSAPGNKPPPPPPTAAKSPPPLPFSLFRK